MIRMINVFIFISGCFLGIALSNAQEPVAQTEDTAQQDSGSQKGTSNASSTGLTITTDGVTTVGNIANEGNLGSAYVCMLNGLQRRVEIDLLNAPEPVPCEVNYYKDNESPDTKTTLWSAQNDSYYCENQAKNFIEKLQAMNWECSGS